MIPAIILAAGASSRMGRTKALLPLPGGGCFLTRVEETLRTAGIREIVAVIGRDAKAIRAAVEGGGSAPPRSPGATTADLRLRLVENPDPARGQLSSLLVGLDAILAGRGVPPAVLVTIVDSPLVCPETVRMVMEAWRTSGAAIVRPARGGRHGHPVIFAASIFEELRAADPLVGARAVVRAHEAEIVEVPVDDPGAFDDIDTPGDYERLVPRQS